MKTPAILHGRLTRLIVDNSLLLVVGTVLALVWANVHDPSYQRFAHSWHFVANDLGMVFFFGLAAKEVYEAVLPGGALSSPRQAAVPLIAAVGGMVGPALIYLAIVTLQGRADLVRGWAIPCATDIAFSYMFARFIFPAGHPAIPFLLLLAIADDALGLVVLAVFYPMGAVSLTSFFALMAPALAMAWWLRRQRVRGVWPYVIGAGSLSWAALFFGGFHPALALVPIVPFMPHPRPAAGARGPDAALASTLVAFEHWWRMPVQVVLFLFGLVNAGVAISAVGAGTWAVATGLLVGKPLGVSLAAALAVTAGFQTSRGLDTRAIVVVGTLTGIGFTVALFFATAAFPEGSQLLDNAKMGALTSFAAAPAALVLARLLGVGRTAGA